MGDIWLAGTYKGLADLDPDDIEMPSVSEVRETLREQILRADRDRGCFGVCHVHMREDAVIDIIARLREQDVLVAPMEFDPVPYGAPRFDQPWFSAEVIRNLMAATPPLPRDFSTLYTRTPALRLQRPTPAALQPYIDIYERCQRDRDE